MPHVKVNFGKLGNDVWRFAAGGDHVVDSREIGRVFAHQLGSVIGELDGVEGAPASPWRPGGMGADPLKRIEDGDEAAVFVGSAPGRREVVVYVSEK